jgi:hypothetical protein
MPALQLSPATTLTFLLHACWLSWDKQTLRHLLKSAGQSTVSQFTVLAVLTESWSRDALNQLRPVLTALIAVVVLQEALCTAMVIHTDTTLWVLTPTPFLPLLMPAQTTSGKRSPQVPQMHVDILSLPLTTLSLLSVSEVALILIQPMSMHLLAMH